MAAYDSGSVNMIVGGQSVKGNGTQFTTYVTVGNVFKIKNENVYYSVAAVTSATRLTLSGRYANNSYRTTRLENVATLNSASRIRNFTASFTPLIQNSIVVKATSKETFTDDGAGVLTGDGGGSGTIDYDSGTGQIICATFAVASRIITASYYSGNRLNGAGYQVLTDFTTNYEYPEVAVNDANPQYIITKALRDLDVDRYDASRHTEKVASNIQIKGTSHGTAGSYFKFGDHKYIFWGNKSKVASIQSCAASTDASCRGSLYIGKGKLFILTSDTVATSFAVN